MNLAFQHWRIFFVRVALSLSLTLTQLLCKLQTLCIATSHYHTPSVSLVCMCVIPCGSQVARYKGAHRKRGVQSASCFGVVNILQARLRILPTANVNSARRTLICYKPEVLISFYARNIMTVLGYPSTNGIC